MGATRPEWVQVSSYRLGRHVQVGMAARGRHDFFGMDREGRAFLNSSSGVGDPCVPSAPELLRVTVTFSWNFLGFCASVFSVLLRI
jgi:hypothetical protein